MVGRSHVKGGPSSITEATPCLSSSMARSRCPILSDARSAPRSACVTDSSATSWTGRSRAFGSVCGSASRQVSCRSERSVSRDVRSSALWDARSTWRLAFARRPRSGPSSRRRASRTSWTARSSSGPWVGSRLRASHGRSLSSKSLASAMSVSNRTTTQGGSEMAVAARPGVVRERMLIAGELVESADGRTFDVETPATGGKRVAHVPRSGAADVDRAVRAADAAFPAWRAVAPRDRGRLLLRIADDLEAAVEDLARTLATETGNAIRTQARPEAKMAADVFRYFGGPGGERQGERNPRGETVFSYTRREAVGVVPSIGRWNVPILIAAWKIAPALVAGNTGVLKPSASAPLAALELARICATHLPKGVLNVITGTGEEVGTPLAAHPLVRKSSFTGNTETGKAILRLAADRIIPVTLELGGKSPQILHPDADEERTADGVIAAMRFARQGQSCTAGSRLFIHTSVFDAFLDRLAAKLPKLKGGEPLDEGKDIGAIGSRQQFEKVVGNIDAGLHQSGARTVIGGRPPSEGPLATGYYV